MTIKNYLIVLLATLLIASTVQVHAFTKDDLKSYSLDKLFSLLQKETDGDQARLIEGEIWEKWLKAESDDIDYLMNDAFQFRREYNFELAIQSLNDIIQRVPHYSEAWNQRAIVYFYQGKPKLALKDIDKALELEPRHFGALAGKAVIHLQLEEFELAKKSIKKALAIHPFIPEVQLFPDLDRLSKP